MFYTTLYVLAVAPSLARAAICAFDDDNCDSSYSPGTYFGIAAAVFCLIFLLLVCSVIARRRRMRRNKTFMQMQTGGATALGPNPRPAYSQPFYAPWNRPTVPPSADVNSPYFQPAPPYEPPQTPLAPGVNEPSYPPPSYKQPL
ncbi:uncharacterized protein SCHCODRAFT_02670444 [Schizophyllum commune H4-8]|nr:uncharacterized protein SCHCODRAFT_02670444 [Schizophyllum commune H4-8]KAI5889453.1 hypothetical protein SCHCODRAFT_02670444 [Schizophyllum commune H4-8]